jgi:hypothetical protein
VIYKQTLKAEEAYLGFTDKNPLSNSASQMTLRSKWPNHDSASQITIEFDKQRIILFSSELFLDYHMPYPFDHTKGSAKFVKDRKELLVTLPRTDISN